MAKRYTVNINRFDGGISEDKRVQAANKYSITKHFDALTYPHKLVPYAKREASLGVSGQTVDQMKLTRMLYAPSGASFKLWGLGDDGAGKLKVFRFDIDGASGSLDAVNWVAASNGTSAVGTRQETMFFYYKTFIYMLSGTTSLCRFDTAESAAFSDGYQTLATTTTAIQPVLHPTDDVAYFFSDNVVYSLNNVTWNGAVLTLPSTLRIVAACPLGNYLAIGCVTTGNLDQRSIIYLWDRDSSLATLTERVDMGEGIIIHMANLNGRLVVVMSLYVNNVLLLGKGKILIKIPNGQIGKTVNEITVDTAQVAADFSSSNFVRDNKLYFPCKATLNSDKRVGIWVVDENGRLTLDQYDSALETTSSAFKGIYATANVWWIIYDNGSGLYLITRTDDDNAYDTSNACIYESLLFTGGDSSKTKKLVGVTVTTEPLPTAGEVILKYRKNVLNADGTYTAETSWTQIFDHTTDNSVLHDAVNIESSGATLPQFNEIQFQISSLGGAVITGLRFDYEEIEDGLY